MTTIAIKSLNAERKLILTGTPLQNRVTELWSLFDFLMPGFLEDENVFNRKYTKYLSASIKKIGEKEKETEQFLMSIQSLRERIAPFILRRTKENVMKELPAKIIQDYPCTLSPSQEYIHEILEKMFPYVEGMKSIDTKAQDTNVNKHAIENLLAHRRLCNHPSLVTTNKKIMKFIFEGVSKDIFQKELNNLNFNQEFYQQSGKLQSLLSLLEECGIVSTSVSGKIEPSLSGKSSKDDSMSLTPTFLTDEDSETHRALIFCQFKDFMEIIEKEILKKFGIKYLVLGSALNPKQRLQTANKFNQDTKYKILLTSTNIGGLGLNLTGADTVIFVEHDWNPMKDLQAMDRAHRLGQTKTVTVYRLITMNTLEEKIMGLQRFKEKLHRILIADKETTGNDGQDVEKKIELSNILKSFENQDAFKDQLSKNISSINGMQVDGEDDECENFLSKVDQEWIRDE